MEHVTLNFAPVVRRETRDGRAYIVAPLTLIVPGVLNGSKGPLYYPPDEVRRSAAAWHGTPIVVYHPPRSASDPGILDSYGVGTVRNSRFDGRKLVAEGWFDIERTRRVDGRVLRSLEAGTPVELSTGLFTDNEPTSGFYNGRAYDAIARNYRPDHLAVLPDQVGACSIRDGCGVLVNQEFSTEEIMNWIYSRPAKPEPLPVPEPVFAPVDNAEEIETPCVNCPDGQWSPPLPPMPRRARR